MVEKPVSYPVCLDLLFILQFQDRPYGPPALSGWYGVAMHAVFCHYGMPDPHEIKICKLKGILRVGRLRRNICQFAILSKQRVQRLLRELRRLLPRF